MLRLLLNILLQSILPYPKPSHYAVRYFPVVRS